MGWMLLSNQQPNSAHSKTSRETMEIAGRDGRTEEASNPSVRVREEGRGRVKCPKSMQISPHSTSNAAASDRFCGLGQEFDCNLRMVNSESQKRRDEDGSGPCHAMCQVD